MSDTSDEEMTACQKKYECNEASRLKMKEIRRILEMCQGKGYIVIGEACGEVASRMANRELRES